MTTGATGVLFCADVLNGEGDRGKLPDRCSCENVNVVFFIVIAGSMFSDSSYVVLPVRWKYDGSGWH